MREVEKEIMANEIFKMSTTELAKVKQQVNSINKSLHGKSKISRSVKNEIDKDAFLKLLTIQLSHQDPLAPMDNNQFIAQMAQFSSLEQMKNVSDSMEHLKSQNARATSIRLIGNEVTYKNDLDVIHSGVVEKVVLVGGDSFLYINNEKVAMKDIVSVKKVDKNDLSSVSSGVSPQTTLEKKESLSSERAKKLEVNVE